MPITPPLKDENGFAVPHDHPEILDDHRLIRGISKQFIQPDTQGQLYLSSATLDPSSKEVDPYCGLSVDIEELMNEKGMSPAEHVKERNFLGSIGFKVHSFRSQNFLVGYDPLPTNECHGVVWGDAARNSKLTKGRIKALLNEAAEWVVRIEGVRLGR